MANPTNFQTVPLDAIPQIVKTAEFSEHRPVVLVVDEEQTVADTRAAVLNRWGYAAFTACDVESAFALARLVPPELLICDVLMTGMNGVDLAIAMKEMVPDCKVLLLYGQVGTDILSSTSYSDHGFAALTKPIHPEDMLAQLAKLKDSVAPAHPPDSGTVTRLQFDL